MNEVLHKHLVIRSHNSPMSWEQLFAVVWRMSWGCEETGRVQAASSTHKTQWPWGAGSCVCTKNSHPYVHEKRAQKPDFSQKLLSIWMRIVKTERFLLPQCLPTTSVQSSWWPSPALCPSIDAVGGGTGTLAPLLGPAGQRCWTGTSQPPGKHMPILAREWQEVSKQKSIGFRHVLEGNNKEKCSCSQMNISHQKTFQAKEKRKH